MNDSNVWLEEVGCYYISKQSDLQFYFLADDKAGINLEDLH